MTNCNNETIFTESRGFELKAMITNKGKLCPNYGNHTFYVSGSNNDS